MTSIHAASLPACTALLLLSAAAARGEWVPQPRQAPSSMPKMEGIRKVVCKARTDAVAEARFCAALGSRLERYAPIRVAANRTLSQSTIEFSGWWQASGVIASVLVTDPVGKNTVKVVLPADIEPAAAAERVVNALTRVLQVKVTAKNVGWVIVDPKLAGKQPHGP